jgi:excisionase family DNA binding protein
MPDLYTESEAAAKRDVHPTEMPIRPLAYSIENAAKACDVSESTVTRAISAGELTISKIGVRTLIPAWSLESWIRSKETRRTKATVRA